MQNCSGHNHCNFDMSTSGIRHLLLYFTLLLLFFSKSFLLEHSAGASDDGLFAGRILSFGRREQKEYTAVCASRIQARESQAKLSLPNINIRPWEFNFWNGHKLYSIQTTRV